MRNSVLALMMALLSSVSGSVVCYHIEPVKAAWSGWTGFQDTVSQTVTCNFDSLSYVELFCGDHGAGGGYNVEVRDVVTNDLLARKLNVTPGLGHSWLRFEPMEILGAFTKGKTLTIRFTRSGADSIMYYYQDGDPYKYGFMVTDQPHAGQDLACRVYGVMRPCAAQYWGTVPELQYVPAGLRGTWLARAESAGIGWAHVPIYWDSIQPDNAAVFDFARLDTELHYVHDSAGCDLHADVQLCPGWASSRLDGEHHCPPRKLWAAGTDTNYYARFIDALVRHCDSIGCSLHEFSIWNEENDTGPPSSGITGWFQHPDTVFYPGVDTGLRGLCSLYVRMVAVAAATIRSIPGHANDRISLGGLFRSTASARHLVNGVDWLRTCYDIAGGSVPWDVVSVHPYQDRAVMFTPDILEADARALRAVVDSAGHSGTELWNIEVGVETGRCSEERFAAGMFEMYTVSRGSEALPEGGYDRACWFYFWWPQGWGSWGMVKPDGTPTAGFHAFNQMTHTLTGKRFNGRVMTGDVGTDTLVRMYEFEDTATLKRTWVCWKNGDTAGGSVIAKLPVRVDTVAGESLAYSDSTAAFLPAPGSDGWLPFNLTERPVFITEGSDTVLRPDLRVDSAKYAVRQGQARVQAWVTNHGTRGTPSDQTQTPYPTVAELYGNGTYIQRQERTTTIPRNEQVSFQFNLGQPTSDTVLYSVQVNPAQTYVELSTDDNAGYRLKTP